MYEIKYVCYKCRHKFIDIYECACDAECPECDAKDITPIDYKDVNDVKK